MNKRPYQHFWELSIATWPNAKHLLPLSKTKSVGKGIVWVRMAVLSWGKKNPTKLKNNPPSPQKLSSTRSFSLYLETEKFARLQLSEECAQLLSLKQ